MALASGVAVASGIGVEVASGLGGAASGRVAVAEAALDVDDLVAVAGAVLVGGDVRGRGEGGGRIRKSRHCKIKIFNDVLNIIS